MTGSFAPLPMLDLVASLGGVLGVAGLAYRLAHPGTAIRSWRGSAMHAAAGFVACVGAAGAFWLGGDALIVLFAVISALALRDATAAGASFEGKVLAACCYGCVPLQYGALMAGRLDWAAVAVPIVAVQALPLFALAPGGTRHFVARASQPCWSVMAWVYCLSFVPALLLLDGPAFEDRNAGLVSFVVAVSLAAQALRSWSARAPRGFIWLVRAAAMLVLGAALAWMIPFSAPVSAALALATAMPGWLGASALQATRARAASRACGGTASAFLVRPDALVFAGPLFFGAMRVMLP